MGFGFLSPGLRVSIFERLKDYDSRKNDMPYRSAPPDSDAPGFPARDFLRIKGFGQGRLGYAVRGHEPRATDIKRPDPNIRRTAVYDRRIKHTGALLKSIGLNRAPANRDFYCSASWNFTGACLLYTSDAADD